ncbi:MAG: hypothetical protein IT427_06510 [Pirellulales bacterium]|nr:hypothetical protein [Pirellulales bacterium]
MSDLFQSIMNLQSPFNMVVLIVLIGSLFGLLRLLVIQVRIYASHREDLQLKRELVERGLSAEEIERIVLAKSPNEKTSC